MNDKIHKAVEELGFCCPFGFFGCNQRKSDSNRKLSQKTGLSVRTIEYSRQKIREGTIACEGKDNCMKEQFTK